MRRLEIIVGTFRSYCDGLPIRASLVALILCWMGLWGAPAASASAGGENTELDFRNPTPIRDIYQALAEQLDFRVVFDPKLHDHQLVIDLSGLQRNEALHILTQAANHFTKDLSDGAVLIAPDTPQSRRNHTTQVVKVVALENLPTRDAMTILRSLFGLKHVTAQEEHRQVVLRDSTETVALASGLLARIDKPRAEVDVAVEVFLLEAGQQSKLHQQLLAAQGTTSDGLPRRLSAAQLAILRRNTQPIASPQVSVFDGQGGEVHLTKGYRLENGETLELGLQLAVTSRVHSSVAETTLEVELGVTDLASSDISFDGQVGPTLDRRRVTTALRLATGESLLLQGFSGSGHDGMSIARLLGAEAGHSEGEVLIALTPRIVRQSGYRAEDLAAVCVGTETKIGLCP